MELENQRERGVRGDRERKGGTGRERRQMEVSMKGKERKRERRGGEGGVLTLATRSQWKYVQLFELCNRL